MVAKMEIFIDRYRHPSLFVSLPPVAERPRRLIGGYGAGRAMTEKITHGTF